MQPKSGLVGASPSDSLLKFLACLPCSWCTSIWKTWTHAWATTSRFHEQEILPCLLGCSSSATFAHYVRRPRLWRTINRVCSFKVSVLRESLASGVGVVHEGVSVCEDSADIARTLKCLCLCPSAFSISCAKRLAVACQFYHLFRNEHAAQARMLSRTNNVQELAQFANDVAAAAFRFVSLCALSRGAVHKVAAIRS